MIGFSILLNNAYNYQNSKLRIVTKLIVIKNIGTNRNKKRKFYLIKKLCLL